MNNRIFNVNGEGNENLLKALELVFIQRNDYRPDTCVGWYETKRSGLVLTWCGGDDRNELPFKIHKFPTGLSASDCLPFVSKWLGSDFAKSVELGKGCHDIDHDGHNTIGWQVYVEEWGRVGGDYKSICAIRPAYMWHGK